MNGLILTVAVTFAIQVAVSAAGIAGPVLAPFAGSQLSLSASLIGIYVAFMYLTAAIVTATSGAWLQRFGPMGTSQLCLVFSGLSLLAIASGTLWGFALGGLLAGIGYGPTTPASSVVLSRAGANRFRNLIFSIKQTGVPGGNMASAAILPTLALAVGWQTAALTAGGGVLALAAALTPLRKTLDEGAQIARAPSLRAALAGPMRKILVTPKLRSLVLLSMAYSGLQGVLSTTMIVFLIEEAHLTVVAAGLVLAAAQGAGVGGRILWGIVADRTGRPALVLGSLGLAMGVFGIATAYGAPHLPLPVLTALAVCFGGTAVAWNGVYLAELASLVEPGRAGEIVGAAGLFTFGGVAILPFAYTLIVLAASSHAAALALLSLPAIAGGAWLLRGARAQAKPGA